MTVDAAMRSALAAAVEAFNPDRRQSMCCITHQWDCPTDSPKWRAHYEGIVQVIQSLQSWRQQESFEEWLARDTRSCHEATERERLRFEALRDGEREATLKGAEHARQWLAENVPQPTELLERIRRSARPEGA
jgi:hypothetical protein